MGWGIHLPIHLSEIEKQQKKIAEIIFSYFILGNAFYVGIQRNEAVSATQAMSFRNCALSFSPWINVFHPEILPIVGCLEITLERNYQSMT